MRHWLLFSLASAITVTFFGVTQAQNDVLDEFYGQGHHAYFRGDPVAAEAYLTTAIGEGSKDPRVFYYRGLANLCQGKLVEAEVDFHDGAVLEAEGHGRLIGRALERIQGQQRLVIEKARRDARLEVAQRRGFAQPNPPSRELPPMKEHPSPEPDSEPEHEPLPSPDDAMVPADDDAETPLDTPPVSEVDDRPIFDSGQPMDEPMVDEPTIDAEPAADEPAADGDTSSDSAVGTDDPFGDGEVGSDLSVDPDAATP